MTEDVLTERDLLAVMHQIELAGYGHGPMPRVITSPYVPDGVVYVFRDPELPALELPDEWDSWNEQERLVWASEHATCLIVRP